MLATKLGHATAMDRKNAAHVLRYLKGVPRIMTVKGETFDEDTLDSDRWVSARAGKR